MDKPIFSKEIFEKCIKGEGYFKSKPCSVKGADGVNCPEMPIIQISETFLCERCHKNILMGAYGKENKENLEQLILKPTMEMLDG